MTTVTNFNPNILPEQFLEIFTSKKATNEEKKDAAYKALATTKLEEISKSITDSTLKEELKSFDKSRKSEIYAFVKDLTKLAEAKENLIENNSLYQTHKNRFEELKKYVKTSENPEGYDWAVLSHFRKEIETIGPKALKVLDHCLVMHYYPSACMRPSLSSLLYDADNFQHTQERIDIMSKSLKEWTSYQETVDTTSEKIDEETWNNTLNKALSTHKYYFKNTEELLNSLPIYNVFSPKEVPHHVRKQIIEKMQSSLETKTKHMKQYEENFKSTIISCLLDKNMPDLMREQIKEKNESVQKLFEEYLPEAEKKAEEITIKRKEAQIKYEQEKNEAIEKASKTIVDDFKKVQTHFELLKDDLSYQEYSTEKKKLQVRIQGLCTFCKPDEIKNHPKIQVGLVLKAGRMMEKLNRVIPK